MKALLALLALLVATPEPHYFHYQRPVQTLAGTSGQGCLALDAEVFAHAAPGLADLRLYRGGVETPYLLQLSKPPEAKLETLLPLNAGQSGSATVFDVEMPARHYGKVDLALSAENFVATVTVSGSQSQSGARTRIGAYTIFDLTRQRLGRGTMLELPDSDYRYLHFELKGLVKAESIQGVSLPTAVEVKPRYAAVAASGRGTTEKRVTVATVDLPAHVPLDRIVVKPAASPAQFSRPVRVTALPEPPAKDQPAREEFVTVGTLLRMHGMQQGSRIDREQLELETPGQIFDRAMRVKVEIENGDDAPLVVEQVRLEMVERLLCFEAAGSAETALYYGDDALVAPHYDYGSLNGVQAGAVVATLAAEVANPSFQPRPDARPLTEKHPGLLWVGLCVALAVLAWATARTAQQRLRKRE